MTNAAAEILTVGALRRESRALSPDALNAEVAALFEADPNVPAFAIVHRGVPVGMIDRLGFMSRFAARYGRDMYARKPISRLMDPEPLAVDSAAAIDDAAQLIFTRKPKALTTGFILTQDGRFDGVATGVDLLQALSRSLAAANQRLILTQDTLVQSEKMAALGALVAGVAHEVNTPVGSALTAATAFAERVKSFADLTSGGSIRRSDIDRFVASSLEAAHLMQTNIGRAAALIAGFKQVAVDQSDDARRRFDVRRLLEDVLMSLSPRLRKEGVSADLACGDGMECDGYPGALAQIVTNLVMNALNHAFDGGGEKRILVSVDPVGATHFRLRVVDNGRGVPAEIKPRVFDPFFTTKRGVGGSGLGLHIVYNLVTRRLGGGIAVEDTAPSGAAFDMRLPLTAPDGGGA